MIQVGEVLDKYELLERVGQGGMAVVYRGLDRSLKRVVAVKILHKHLADYQEARDRFEREAQAVAKLRHENILEIFDYSGADEAKAAGSSYIVTEFIDGHTLKQLTVERPIHFPELGAMIILQVCRALAHAHAAGILHRDVKPENIMVRSDGVVKLMDFGISHMVDLERLTVTGQLLGSPAYMAPEHVEGRPLDFRTDVFAAGIVLYQLCVGKLPFEGKNPHEVLKRIAECKFVDPRQANPQIGNRLGRIILKAMAAEPRDRFGNVTEMVHALEGYLEESGIEADKVVGELARYFQAPVSYEQAFETRLVDHLTTRGNALLVAENRAAALDVFDRVLTIDPDNEKVLAILDRLNRRQRVQRAAIAGVVVCVMAVCVFFLHRRSRPIDGELPDGTARLDNPIAKIRDHAGQRDDLAVPVPLPDAAVAVVEPPSVPDAHVAAIHIDAGAKPTVDAPPAVVAVDITVRVNPLDARVQFGDGPWLPAVGGVITQRIENDTLVRASHERCQTAQQLVKPGVQSGPVVFNLEWRPASITPVCGAPNATVRIDDGETADPLWTIGTPRSIYFRNTGTVQDKTVTVTFEIAGKTTSRSLRVRPAQSERVSCER